MAPAWHNTEEASKSKFEHCAADDPNRCQSVISAGQCHYKAVPGSPYCMRHGGSKVAIEARKQALSNYRLSVWKQRLDEMRENVNIKSLRDEIGISRIVLEEIMNMCKDSHELLMQHSKINQTVITLEKLISSCQRLEERNAYLLDKDQLFVIMDNITKIISEYVTDPDKLNEIGSKIYDTIAATTGGADEGKSAT